jgi:carboxypeptidase Q
LKPPLRAAGTILLSLTALFNQQGVSQTAPATPEGYDSAAVARIVDEGMNHSRVMETLSWLTDICGPRLTGSPGYRKALVWTQSTLKEWGLSNVHKEGWGPFGRGWSITRYSAHVIAPVIFPLLSYPKAWSPETDGTVTGGVVYCNAKSDSALLSFRGKLKGAIVLLGDPPEVEAHWQPQATRLSDSLLLLLANADPQSPRGRRPGRSRQAPVDPMFEYRKLSMIVNENAAAILTPSRGDGGTIFVQSASGVDHPDTPWTRRTRVWDLRAPKMIPQAAVAAEQFDRLVRMLEKGVEVKVEMQLSVATTEEDSVYNVLAEIPGTDLKDEIVMIGAHLDSWHGGTGATDNGTGVASCMEAMRILKTLGLKTRRTIRLGLWAAEEQGLLGSRAYVRNHLGERPMLPDTGLNGPNMPGPAKLKPDGEKFSAYFNSDNGTGRIRGVYMQGNEAVRPIFRSWLNPFRTMGASTLAINSTGSTDHASFDAVGLPAFQFIQDNIEYFTRTWHSTMDVYDRVLPEDLKQASVIIASFAYNAAMRNDKLPRKLK